MDNVIKMPGLEHFQRDAWQFFIDEYSGGARIQTHQNDERIVCAISSFERDGDHFVAMVTAVGNAWLWEVESAHYSEGSFERTLASAVAAADALVTRNLRVGNDTDTAA